VVFPGPLVSSINKTDRHDITEILLKVALSTIKPNQTNVLLGHLAISPGEIFNLKKYTKYPDTSSLWFLRKQLFPHKVETMCGSGYFGFQIITKTYFCRVLPKDHFR
jgi:hypothetical protein